MWPRKKGGRDSLGDLGKEDDYIFNRALANTWNVVTAHNEMHADDVLSNFIARMYD